LDTSTDDLESLKELFFAGQSSSETVTMKCIQNFAAWFGDIIPEIQNPAYRYLSVDVTDEDDGVRRNESSFTISDIIKFLNCR
jgi:hypothetical protein